MRRSETMSTAELVENIDIALMTGSQAISRYRSGINREDQLWELRMNLEAALGMLDNCLRE